MIRKTLVLSWLASSVLLGQSPRIIPGRTLLSEDGAVNIAFRLVDANGQPVETLQRDALTVSDNGNPVSGFDLAYRQVSSDEKAYIVLVLDASGSMRFNKKIDNLKRSAINVIDGMSKEDYCAVISFSSHAQLLTGFTNDRTLLKEKVLSITPNGYTAIYDAVFEALNQLDAQPDGQDKLILLISDGEEEGKSLFTLADLIPRIYETKRVRIHTFDLNVKNEVNELRRLAGVSGGSYMYGANSDAVFSAFSGFLRTYRKAYVLSYRPADDPPASHHNVSVCFSVDGIKQQYETEYQGIGQAATMFRTDPDSYLYAGGAAALVAIVGIAGSFAMVRRRKKGYPFAFPQGLRKNSEEPRMAVYPYADQSPDEKTGILDSAGLEGDEEKTVILDDPRRRSAILGYLYVRGPQTDNSSIELDSPEIIIGRSPQCKVHFADSGISRLHAKLRFENDGFVIYDLGSANGTFVNGEEIQKRFLKSDDIIEVGNFQLTYKSASVHSEENP